MQKKPVFITGFFMPFFHDKYFEQQILNKLKHTILKLVHILVN